MEEQGGPGARSAGDRQRRPLRQPHRHPREYLPHDFPPHKTVDDYYAKWAADGTAQQVHDLLRDKTRRAWPRRGADRSRHRRAEREGLGEVAESSQGIDAGPR
ncbi:transposase [Streptomyces poonensis]|uniref:Transposase n=1 Tax=Streptomyces poonensis TaxID=68255 RepID=A0A918Q176_9ACTN|nr:transposase [Streptomyces poonensis]GGZ28893.1 hypothetical protein GCM10010365_56350 [Streptomyces poonensis]